MRFWMWSSLGLVILTLLWLPTALSWKCLNCQHPTARSSMATQVCVCVVSSDVGGWKMPKYFFIPLLSQLLCGDWSHRALPGAASRLILVVWLGFCWHFVGKVFICAFLILQMLLYLYPDLSVQSLSITDISLIWSWGCRYGRACSECCFVAAMTDLHQCHEQPVTL